MELNKHIIDNSLERYKPDTLQNNEFSLYLEKLEYYFKLQNKQEKSKDKTISCPGSRNKEVIYFHIDNDGSYNAECSTWNIKIVPPKYACISDLEKEYKKQINEVSTKIAKIRDNLLNELHDSKHIKTLFEEEKNKYYRLIKNMELLDEYKQNLIEFFIGEQDLKIFKTQLLDLYKENTSRYYLLKQKIDSIDEEDIDEDLKLYVHNTSDIRKTQAEIDTFKKLYNEIPDQIILEMPKVIENYKEKEKKKVKLKKVDEKGEKKKPKKILLKKDDSKVENDKPEVVVEQPEIEIEQPEVVVEQPEVEVEQPEVVVDKPKGKKKEKKDVQLKKEFDTSIKMDKEYYATNVDKNGKIHKGKDIKEGICVPFIYKRKLQTEPIDGKLGKWCATSVDKKGSKVTWGYIKEDSDEN